MKLVIATHNPGKIRELQRILEPMGMEVVTAELTEVEENGTTFLENARIKAEAACKETGLPAVADDSGICVDYLGGAPGVHSARFAAPGTRRTTILQQLDGVPKEQRGAHFTCAVCAVFPNGDVIEAEGHCYGTIATENRGENGFGYDTIFEQDGRTFGEMTNEEKDLRSHRGAALRAFAEKLRLYLSAPCGTAENETLETIYRRISVREYSDQPISEETMRSILQAAMSGPSCVNSRDWAFIVVRDREMLNKMADANGRPAEPLRGAQVGVLVCGNLQRALPVAPSYWVVDASIATQNMILAAKSLGVGSVWLGTWPQMDRVQAQAELFGLPEHIVPHSIVAFGYPREESQKEKQLWEDECVHYEIW